ncbi:MAG TPA: divergent polysaccharide deacetylase family protein [Xanthobacteraceae bacterium]|nr:divergent polysaccharide deacetylase family protein [Xanthobacteraceae bacterium]
MTVDDLSTPLGQQRSKRRRKLPISTPHVLAGALALFLGAFVLWAIVGDDPSGGEPTVAVPIDLHAAAIAKKAEVAGTPEAAAGASGPRRYDGPAPGSAQPAERAPGSTRTVTIIDGKTGARQEVVIPDSGNGAGPTAGASADQKFVEMMSHGLVPKIAADGTRPADAFARPVKPLPGKPDAPRVALIVGGLGVSANATSDAIAKLPGPVTLAFMPYGADVERLVARARSEGHEVLLQVPMEPFEYPDNDPGPQTLLTSLTPEQNLERLYWLMSRFQGYVGLADAMGARFTASEQSFAPILRETAKRGLIFVDEGSNPRSVAGRIAGANNLPFAKADLVLDSVPTPGEIERALGRLEMAARERSVAVGVSSALPVSIERIAKWAKAAESRGLLLVPITAVAIKAKQS